MAALIRDYCTISIPWWGYGHFGIVFVDILIPTPPVLVSQLIDAFPCYWENNLHDIFRIQLSCTLSIVFQASMKIVY